MDRKRHAWTVTLNRDDGEVVERTVRAYWNPEQEGCNDAVAATAKAEAWHASGQRHKFAPIAVARVDAGT